MSTTARPRIRTRGPDTLDLVYESSGGPGAEFHTGPSSEGRGPSAAMLLKALWAKRFWVCATALAAGALTAFYFIRNPITYSSDLLLMFNSAQLDDAERPLMPGEPSPALHRLQHLATSSAVLDQLIVSHDLYRHYFIDTLAPHFHEAATGQLRANISTSILDAGSMSITVRDLDRTKAAQLATALFTELRTIVQEHSNHFYSRQVQLHRDMVAFHTAQAAARKAELAGITAQLAPLLEHPDGKTRSTFVHLEQQLSYTSAQLAATGLELQSMGQRVELMARMNSNGMLGELSLVNRASYDISTRPRTTIVLGVLCGMLIGALLACGAIVLWLKEGGPLRDLWQEARGRSRD